MDLLVIDDDPLIRTMTMQMAEDAGHYAEAAEDADTAMQMLAGARYDLILLDLQLGETSGLQLLPDILQRQPGTPVVVVTGNASVSTAVEAMRIGALDFLEKPFTPELLALILQKSKRHRRQEKNEEPSAHAESALPEQEEARFESICPMMQRTLQTLFRAADTDASILILGESGTGKTVVAREIHKRSKRRAKPIVTINCPSLNPDLLESELFGHVKGAFTGAIRDSWGKVHAADGGTLFLDEVGDLPKTIQAKLLRLLQDREFERVGETTVRRADVRVIAATNRNLQQAVEAGEFREDLFFRLNVISVTLPALRERSGDRMVFAESYLRFFAGRYQRPAAKFSEAAQKLLEAHPWPGNLRELRNAIERAVVLSQTPGIEVEDLPSSVANGSSSFSAVSNASAGARMTLEALTEAHIRSVLTQTNSLGEAAQWLGIDEATLYRRRKKLGI